MLPTAPTHHSIYVALLCCIVMKELKHIHHLTNLSSRKASLFFPFTLHLHFEGVLLKCIFFADNFDLCSHLHHLEPSSSEPSLSLSMSVSSTWHVPGFVSINSHTFLNSPSAICAGNLPHHCLQCMLLSSGALAAALPFRNSSRLWTSCFKSPAYFHYWQIKQQLQTDDDPLLNDRTVLNKMARTNITFQFHF